MCGLTWPVLSAPSTCPSCRHLDQVELGDDAGMEALMQGIGGSCYRPASSNLTFILRLMILSAVMLCAGVCDKKGACVCARGRRWRCSRISACFWRLCG